MRAERNAIRSKALTKPFLWKVERDGVRGFLFGTLHVGVCLGDLPITYLRPMEGADRLLVEGYPENEGGLLEEVSQVLIASTEGSLSERLSAPSWQLLRTNVSIPAEIVDTLTPRSAWQVLQSTNLARVLSGINSNCSLDYEIREHARERNKPILYLETKAEMKEAWKAVLEEDLGPYSAADFDRYLEEELLAEQQREVLDFYAMISAYQSGDSKKIASSTNFNSKLENALLKKRNAAWIPRIEKQFAEPGTTLVVVGAAHLLGADNIVTSLEESGFKVTRIAK
jgi:uncharacterized protein YbaP (TraB family)